MYGMCFTAFRMLAPCDICCRSAFTKDAGFSCGEYSNVVKNCYPNLDSVSDLSLYAV
jgi:hypothetical protein